jgi:hypothetical protein
MSVYTKLAEIQYRLIAPKGQYNSFGKYKYRNCEDILEAVKPLLHELKCLITLSDELVAVGEPVVLMFHKTEEEFDKDGKIVKVYNMEEQKCHQRFYTKATATIIDCETGETYSVTADAREEETKKGMDGSQITGASSSYARKYALGGLLDLDDNKDSDTTNKGEDKPEQKKISADVYTEFMRGKNLFEQYVNKGLIKRESLDNLLKAEAEATTTEAYQRLVNKMKENLKSAEEIENGMKNR